ncbi:MAG: hypothetical protein IJD38_08715 [Clostridia bacterium]|nr:hypothetical protein [Clostridia bacterium]
MSMDRQKKERIAAVAAMAVALLQVILFVLFIFNIIENMYYLSSPLQCILILLLAYTFWHKQRKVAVFLTCCAGVVFCMFLSMIILKVLGI